MENERVRAALEKKALGYDTDEVVEEYGCTDGEAVLLKRKVTKKAVPPDIQAAKILLERQTSVQEMSDEELERERLRLLRLLKEDEN